MLTEKSGVNPNSRPLMSAKNVGPGRIELALG